MSRLRQAAGPRLAPRRRVVESSSRRVNGSIGTVTSSTTEFMAPAFRATFLEQTGLAHMHYAVLMPTLDLCLNRVQNRKGHGFTDRDAAMHMWNQFHQADVETSCLFEDSDMPPSELARLIARHVVSGSFRYPPAAS